MCKPKIPPQRALYLTCHSIYRGRSHGRRHRDRHCRSLLPPDIEHKIPLHCEWVAFSVISEGNDGIVRSRQLAMLDRTSRNLCCVVRHSWNTTAKVLIAVVHVDQHDVRGGIVASSELVGSHEILSGVAVEEVRSSILEVKAKDLAC